MLDNNYMWVSRDVDEMSAHEILIWGPTDNQPELVNGIFEVPKTYSDFIVLDSDLFSRMFGFVPKRGEVRKCYLQLILNDTESAAVAQGQKELI